MNTGNQIPLFGIGLGIGIGIAVGLWITDTWWLGIIACVGIWMIVYIITIFINAGKSKQP
jgi:hypothetical protein